MKESKQKKRIKMITKEELELLETLLDGNELYIMRMQSLITEIRKDEKEKFIRNFNDAIIELRDRIINESNI